MNTHSTCDPPPTSANALLLPSLIAYTKIYATRALSAPRWSSSSPPGDRIATHIPPLTHENSGLPITSAGLRLRRLALAVAGLLQWIIRCSGFSEFEGVDGPIARADYHPFTDAIFDRNRVIAAHALGIQA